MVSLKLNYYTYLVASFLSIVCLAIYAVKTRGQFASILLFLFTAKASYIVFGNLLFAISTFVGRLIKTLFFGSLHRLEVENLEENVKLSLADLIIALGIFRNDLNFPNLAMFGLLFGLKIFHWIVRFRLQHYEQQPQQQMWPVTRVIIFQTLLLLSDSLILYTTFKSIPNYKSVSVLFFFEFSLLEFEGIYMLFKYYSYIRDTFYERSISTTYLLFVDLLYDFIRLVMLVVFIAVIVVNIQIPLHFLRELIWSFSSFTKKVKSFVKFVNISRDLNEKFEEATLEEIGDSDCLVCRETMTSGKKLPCSHIFHATCLETWLSKQQSCPLCQLEIPYDYSYKKLASASNSNPTTGLGDNLDDNNQNSNRCKNNSKGSSNSSNSSNESNTSNHKGNSITNEEHQLLNIEVSNSTHERNLMGHADSESRMLEFQSLLNVNEDSSDIIMNAEDHCKTSNVNSDSIFVSSGFDHSSGSKNTSSKVENNISENRGNTHSKIGFQKECSQLNNVNHTNCHYTENRCSDNNFIQRNEQYREDLIRLRDCYRVISSSNSEIRTSLTLQTALMRRFIKK